MLTHALSILVSFTASGQQAAPLPPPAPLATPARPAATPIGVRRPRPTEEKPREIRIFSLKHARPEELGEIVQDLVDDIDVAVDGRTNSIVVSGDGDSLEKIREILSALDVARPEKKPESVVSLYRLRHLSPGQAAERLTELFESTAEWHELKSQVKIIPNYETGKLIVSGPGTHVVQLGKILNQIDEPTRHADSYVDSYFVQIYCLIDGDTHGEEPIEAGAFPGAGEVLRELRALGLTEPALIFRALTRVDSPTHFEVTGETKQGRNVEVSASVNQSDADAVSVNLSFQLDAPRDSESDTPSNLQTTLHVPLGEQVIVGAAPHAGGATVILVLRVDRTARPKPARSRSSTRSRRFTPSSRGTRLDPSDPNAKAPATRVLVPVKPRP